MYYLGSGDKKYFYVQYECVFGILLIHSWLNLHIQSLQLWSPCQVQQIIKAITDTWFYYLGNLEKVEENMASLVFVNKIDGKMTVIESIQNRKCVLDKKHKRLLVATEPKVQMQYRHPKAIEDLPYSAKEFSYEG